MKIFFSIICALFCVTWAEISLDRERRQTGLNGAHTDAMDVSKNGGFGGSNNPLRNPTPGDSGARLGGGFGGQVSDNVGVGAAVRADVGRGQGGPFLRSPEVGVGATYNSGANSYSLGAGRTFGGSPSNQVGFTFRRTFKRSVDGDDEGRIYRRKRQAMNTAMTNSLSNKPVGSPQFSYQVDAAGNNARNFGAAGNVGAGVKVWEGGRGQSVGVGVGAAGNVARVDGKTFPGTPQVGAGIGYQDGAFSATLGAGRPINGPGRNTQYGLNLGYKFKRSASNEVDHDEEIPHPHFDGRMRRQAALDSALTNSLANKPIGTPQFSYQLDAAGNSGRNFGASGSVGSGVKVWESGPHSVGLGVGASGDLARVDGKTYTGNPQLGAGVGYQNGAFSATGGVGRVMAGPGASNHFGVNLGYRFKREDVDHTAEDFDVDHTAEDLDQGYYI